MSITIRQMRAARALLDWSQKDLAEHAGLSDLSILNIEKGRTSPQVHTIVKIIQAFTLHGVEFLDSDGVRMNTGGVSVLRGAEGLRSFMDDVYETCLRQGGEVCVYNAKPDNWIKWLGTEWNAFHSDRMKEIAHTLTYKITCQKGEDFFLGKGHAEYRHIPDELWDERCTYCYGDRIAFINFQNDFVDVYLLKQPQFADSFRSLFNVVWNTVATRVKA